MRGSPTASVQAAILAGFIVVLLAGYGYLYSLPFEPIVLLPAGSVTLEAGSAPLVRVWNVTGMGGHLAGSWSANRSTPFSFGVAGPTRMLVPLGTSCGIRFDLELPADEYILVWRSGSGVTLTVTAALTVLPADHIVHNMALGPDAMALPCEST